MVYLLWILNEKKYYIYLFLNIRQKKIKIIFNYKSLLIYFQSSFLFKIIQVQYILFKLKINHN